MMNSVRGAVVRNMRARSTYFGYGTVAAKPDTFAVSQAEYDAIECVRPDLLGNDLAIGECGAIVFRGMRLVVGEVPEMKRSAA